MCCFLSYNIFTWYLPKYYMIGDKIFMSEENKFKDSHVNDEIVIGERHNHGRIYHSIESPNTKPYDISLMTGKNKNESNGGKKK